MVDQLVPKSPNIMKQIVHASQSNRHINLAFDDGSNGSISTSQNLIDYSSEFLVLEDRNSVSIVGPDGRSLGNIQLTGPADVRVVGRTITVKTHGYDRMHSYDKNGQSLGSQQVY